MRTVTIKKTVYSFDELDPRIQSKLLDKYSDREISNIEEFEEDGTPYTKKQMEEGEEEIKGEKRVLETFEEVEEFVNEHEAEIVSKVEGESDGWNQKISALDKIMKRENVEFGENFIEDERYEELINNLS